MTLALWEIPNSTEPRSGLDGLSLQFEVPTRTLGISADSFAPARRRARPTLLPA